MSGLVGDEEDGDPGIGQISDEGHDLVTGGRVQCASGLVGQEHATIPHHGTGYRNALALASRHVINETIGQLRHGELFEHGHGSLTCPRAGNPVEFERQTDVLHRREGRDEVEFLEDESELTPSYPCQVVAAQPIQGLPGNAHLPAGGPLQAPGNGEQSGLAGARGTHDRHEFPGVHRQVDVVQGSDLALPVTE